MFIDRVQITCKAGSGGNGVVSWRKEKYIPKGGPFGGNGGKGGSVILEADHNVFALDWFCHRKLLKAHDGQNGGSACKKGKNGEDLILKIPMGTTAKDLQTGKLLFDFSHHGEELILCEGGNGGRGNYSFRSSTNRAPNVATKGAPGKECQIELELKLIADVGFIGLPNAGKSTLLHKLSGAQVEQAAYPFTTLRPNLGWIGCKEGERLCLADIPGIIEGAHRGRGLGFEFLRHIERTKILLYVIDSSGREGISPVESFRILQAEMKSYNPSLLQRPFLIALNKSDLDESTEQIKAFCDELNHYKKQTFVVSAACEVGLGELKEALYGMMK